MSLLAAARQSTDRASRSSNGTGARRTRWTAWRIARATRNRRPIGSSSAEREQPDGGRAAEREGACGDVRRADARQLAIVAGAPASAVAKVNRASMHDIAARLRHGIDHRARRPAKLRGEPVGRDLKFLHRVLRDILQRPAHHVVVVVHAVDGDVAAAAGLSSRRHNHRLRFGRIEVGCRGAAGRQECQLEEVAAVQRQRLDLAGRDNRADDRAQHVDGARGAGDRDLLADG